MVKRKNIWKGSYVQRGGVIHDKWGNIKKVPITYRQRGRGIIVTEKGAFIGVEKTLANYYGRDKKLHPIRKGFVSEAQRKAVMAKLRRR